MEYLDIRKHKLNKLIKDGEIGVHKNEKSGCQKQRVFGIKKDWEQIILMLKWKNSTQHHFHFKMLNS